MFILTMICSIIIIGSCIILYYTVNPKQLNLAYEKAKEFKDLPREVAVEKLHWVLLDRYGMDVNKDTLKLAVRMAHIESR